MRTFRTISVGDELNSESRIEIVGKTILKGLFTIFLINAVYPAIFLNHDWTIFSYPDFTIHEAGHSIFSWFGIIPFLNYHITGFLHVLGGSLTQILVPLIIAIYFLIIKKYYSMFFGIYWFGESLINNSVYIADARCRCIPLWPPNSEGHDWNFMLGKLNLLEYDTFIAGIERGIGSFIVILALALMIIDIFYNLMKLFKKTK